MPLPKNPKEDRLLTVKEVQEIIPVGKTRIHELTNQRKLRYVNIGKLKFIWESDALEYLQKNTIETNDGK